MSKKFVYILLLILGVLAAYIILGDFLKNEVKKGAKNPYAFDIRDFEQVDPSLIKYRESKRIKLNNLFPSAIDYHEGKLALGFADQIQLIDTSGREIFKTPIISSSTSIFISKQNLIYLGCKTHVEIYDLKGSILTRWAEIDTGAYITSISMKDDHIIVANAGGPEIILYSIEGQVIARFDGAQQKESEVGFVIPSPYFDVDTDPDGVLWIANTGLQKIQNYTMEGKLRAFWGESGYDLQDFTGCCNPAHFAVLSDGSFVTCEKGLVRIKVYKPSGELDAFVAPPKSFAGKSEPLDLTADEHDNIYALDISQGMIRKFKRL
jgi:hypothetical protein